MLSATEQEKRNAFRNEIVVLKERYLALFQRNALASSAELLSRSELVVDETSVLELENQGEMCTTCPFKGDIFLFPGSLAALNVHAEQTKENLKKELIFQRIKEQVSIACSFPSYDILVDSKLNGNHW